MHIFALVSKFRIFMHTHVITISKYSNRKTHTRAHGEKVFIVAVVVVVIYK